MKNNKKGENLVGVIIAVFILSFTILGIISITSFDKDTSITFLENIEKHIIYSNTQNIIKKIDDEISGDLLAKDEKFYLYKNTGSGEFQILTGATNESYKYIDKFFTKTNLANETKKVYELVFTKKADILKQRITPPEIPNLVFHFDATNINGNYNNGITDGQTISEWKDLSGNNNNATQSTNTYQAKYSTGGTVSVIPLVVFDGVDDTFTINDSSLIDTNTGYYEKSIALVLKTSFDVNADQTIYEQGDQNKGYNITIHNKHIYAGIWNNLDWDFSHRYKYVDLGFVLPKTLYFITMVQDSAHYTGVTPIDNQNKLKIYLNGVLRSEIDHVDYQRSHTTIGLGSINNHTAYPTGGTTVSAGYFLNGGIGELISWNHALSANEITGVQNYFIEKWLSGKQNVNYNAVNTELRKIINSNQ